MLHGGPGNDMLEGAAGPRPALGRRRQGHGHVRVAARPVTASLDDTANDGEAGRERLHPHRRRGHHRAARPDTLVRQRPTTRSRAAPATTPYRLRRDRPLYGRGRVRPPPPGLGEDFLYGGDDRHVLLLDRHGYVLRAVGPGQPQLDGNANDGEPGEGDFIDDDVESLTGGSNSDTLIGNGRGNVLSGNGGQDTLVGLGSPFGRPAPARTSPTSSSAGQARTRSTAARRAASATNRRRGRAPTRSPTHRAATTSRSSSTTPPGRGRHHRRERHRAEAGTTDHRDDGPNIIYAGAGNDCIDGGGERGRDPRRRRQRHALAAVRPTTPPRRERGRQALGGIGADTMSGGTGLDTVDYGTDRAGHRLARRPRRTTGSTARATTWDPTSRTSSAAERHADRRSTVSAEHTIFGRAGALDGGPKDAITAAPRATRLSVGRIRTSSSATTAWTRSPAAGSDKLAVARARTGHSRCSARRSP